MPPIGPRQPASIGSWIERPGHPGDRDLPGGDQPYVTALDVLKNHGVDVSGVVVSESLENARTTDTVESLREFVGRDFGCWCCKALRRRARSLAFRTFPDLFMPV